MVLTADKGVALVVMDKDTYIEKYMTLLSDHRVYQECRELIKTIHNKVIKQLTDLKQFRPRVQEPLPKTVPLETAVLLLGFMDFLISMNQMSHSDP